MLNILIYVVGAQVVSPSASTPLTSSQSAAINSPAGKKFAKSISDLKPKLRHFINVYKPLLVNNEDIPSQLKIKQLFESRKMASLNKKSIVVQREVIAGCKQIDKTSIGVPVVGTGSLNGMAYLFACASGSAIVTLEVFDLSYSTTPAMSISLGESYDYTPFNGGNLVSMLMKAPNARKFQIYEWIGGKKSISLSAIAESNLSDASLRDISLNIIQELNSTI